MNSDRPPTQWPMRLHRCPRRSRARTVSIAAGQSRIAMSSTVNWREARRQVRARAVVEQPDVVAVLAEVLDPVLGHGVDRERAGGVAVARRQHERALVAELVAGEPDLGAVGGRHGVHLGSGSAADASGLGTALADSIQLLLRHRIGDSCCIRRPATIASAERPVATSAERPGNALARVLTDGYGCRPAERALLWRRSGATGRPRMQSAMNRLSAFVRRRRKLVLDRWLVAAAGLDPVRVAARPRTSPAAASRSPGSGSAEVDKADHALPGRQQRAARRRAAAQGRRRRRRAGGRRPRRQGRREGRPRRADRRRPRRSGQAAPPPSDADRPAAARRHRHARRGARGREGPARRARASARSRDGVQPYVVGQQALWAGMQELQKEDLEKAETTGFPLDPDRAAGGLRLGRSRRCCRSGSASPR